MATFIAVYAGGSAALFAWFALSGAFTSSQKRTAAAIVLTWPVYLTVLAIRLKRKKGATQCT